MEFNKSTLNAFSTLIRLRLRAMMDLRGLTCDGVKALLVDRGHKLHTVTIQRWLNGTAAMSLVQVDWLLEALGHSREELMAGPVVTDGDVVMMKAIRDGQEYRTGRGWKWTISYDRLETEGFIVQGDVDPEITEAGDRYLSRRNKKQC